MAGSTPRRVVILGGGFAGVYTALALEKSLGRDPDFEITLVNRENYMVYQPMLPEIISGTIGVFDTVSPLRRLLRKTNILVRDVESVDLERRVVTTSPGFKPVAHHVHYDHLVLALGNVTDFRGLRGLTQHAMPFKNLGDALYLRNHVIHVLEEASIEKDPALRKALLTFVVVGAGYSGVEVIAELNDFVRNISRTYRSIDRSEIRMVLLEFADRILPGISDKLQLLAQKVLRERGVDIRLKTGIGAATADAAILADGSQIPTRTLISTVPASPNPVVDGLGLPKERGKLKTDLRMQVQGTDHVWALGDCALIPDPGGKGFCPPTAQYAVREGYVAGGNIAAAIRGGEQRQLDFKGLGTMGALGHHRAVAEIMGMQFSGLFAWMIWRGVYLSKLPGWDRKVRTGAAWLTDMILPPDHVQLKLAHGQGVAEEHFEPGQAVFEQGELGDRLYIIVKGRCVVTRQENGTEQLLADLGPGEYFGEIALLNRTTRGATVRCTEPLDVLSVRKGEITTLMGHLPALKDSLEQMMVQRAGTR
jgi:NADH:ubiquinone reductase (H+-translocating)